MLRKNSNFLSDTLGKENVNKKEQILTKTEYKN